MYRRIALYRAGRGNFAFSHFFSRRRHRAFCDRSFLFSLYIFGRGNERRNVKIGGTAYFGGMARKCERRALIIKLRGISKLVMLIRANDAGIVVMT